MFEMYLKMVPFFVVLLHFYKYLLVSLDENFKPVDNYLKTFSFQVCYF